MYAARSQKSLEGVNLDLIRVLESAYPEIQLLGYDIIVTEGIRTPTRQQELLKTGRSTTLNSRHLTGHAVDLAVVKNGKVTWSYPVYTEVAGVIKDHARKLEIDVEWGGDWRSFKDGTHFQLSWAAYPLAPRPKKPSNSTTIAAATAGVPVAAYIPEIFSKFKELVGGLSFLSDGWITGIQLALLLAIVLYIVNERRHKMDREGV